MHRIRNPAYSFGCTEGSNPSLSATDLKAPADICRGFFVGRTQALQHGGKAFARGQAKLEISADQAADGLWSHGHQDLYPTESANQDNPGSTARIVRTALPSAENTRHLWPGPSTQAVRA
jgi:hypothetical protein